MKGSKEALMSWRQFGGGKFVFIEEVNGTKSGSDVSDKWYLIPGENKIKFKKIIDRAEELKLVRYEFVSTISVDLEKEHTYFLNTDQNADNPKIYLRDLGKGYSIPKWPAVSDGGVYERALKQVETQGHLVPIRLVVGQGDENL